MKPIRVLLLFTIMNRGGAETMVMNYYRHIDRSKVQFDFMVHRQERGAYDDEIERLGGRIYRMLPLRPPFIKYRKQVRAFFEEHPEYQIIHGHCSESGYFVYKEASKRGVPHIIAHAHNSHVPFDLKLMVRTWMKHRMRPYLTGRFACGREAAEWLFGKADAREAHILPNAIDTSSYAFRQQIRQESRAALCLDDDVQAICHVGRFQKQKNHDFLIDIFQAVHAKFPKSMLLLIGDGELRRQTEMKVAKLGLQDCVRFLGVRSDVNELLMAADVFLFPSFYEGFGISLLEAQCAGLPCVISDTIPQEACITDLVTRLSIRDTAAHWAEVILQQGETTSRRADYPQRVADAGFDISQNARWLQDYYLSLVK